MSNQLVVIDKRLANWQTLIADLPANTAVLELDPLQDGLTQIADAITAYSNLDSIQILSHGNIGSLQLGSTTLTSKNLNQYTQQLATIGNALTDTGDLLLYGCNVAQGDLGQQFINQLAIATGADIAASTDLTGAANQGGDWVLETNTGSIESDTLNLTETSYTHTLQSTTTNLDFSVANQNMWGTGTALNLDVTWDDLLFSRNISQSFSGFGFSGTADLTANAGLVAHLAASTGSVDLNYGVSVNAQTPDIVKSGEYFIFDTSSYSLTNGLLNSLGPDIASTEFTLDFLFNVNAGLHNLQYDPPIFDPIYFNDITVASVNLDRNLVSLGIGNASYSQQGTYGGYSFSLPSAVATSSGQQTSSQSLTSLTSYGTSSTPLGNLNLDLDAIAQTLFGTPPMSIHQSLGDYINIDFTALDLKANLNASVAQKFTFTPTDISVDLTSSMGEHRSGQLGEQFLFSTPTTGNGNVSITANYTIDGVLRNQTGLVLSASLDYTALDLGITGNVAGYGFNWSPFGGPLAQGSLPEGGLPIGSPLYLYDNSIALDNFGSQTASYTVAYSETAATGGTLTSTINGVSSEINILGTNDADYLFGNDLNNTIQGYAGDDYIHAGIGDDTVNAGDGDDRVYGNAGNDTIDASSGSDTVRAGSGNDTIAMQANYYDYDVVSGGTGIDSLSIDFSANTNNLNWTGLDASGNAPTSSVHDYSSITAIQALLNNAVKLFVGYYNDSMGVIFDSIENLNLTGSNYDDLLIVQGNGNYDGKDGTDTIYADWSNATQTITINNPTTAQTINGSTFINIERWLIKTGSRDDVINAGGYSDEIDSGAGNDTINAGSGIDTIQAGSGNDTIVVQANWGVRDIVSGGTGIDSLSLSLIVDYSISNPWYAINTLGSYTGLNKYSTLSAIQIALSNAVKFSVDTVTFDSIENFNLTGSNYDDLLIVLGNGNYDGKAGMDTIYADWSSATQAIIWNNTPTATTAQTVNGNTMKGLERLLIVTGSGDDVLSNSNAATNDTFKTGAGDDVLNGGAGNDTLIGGTGNDTYVVDATGDVVTENASAGSDTVKSSITYTLNNNVENLTLTGMAAINGTGNTLNNILTGNSGANVLTGGTGNDTYMIRAGDTVNETSTLATEIDTVNSSISYTLGANVERLTLIGIAAINGTGNTLNNILTGNTGANVLTGGTGNDIYVIAVGDTVRETSTLATEIDTVNSSISYALGANVERLTLTGAAAINGTGNVLNNVLTGNSANNSFTGGNGADTLVGGLGKDSVNLSETTAVTDIVRIATGDSLVTGFDVARYFKLGTGVVNTAGVDKLDLVGTSIAANMAKVDGVDAGVIRSHSLSNGMISFDDVNSYAAPVVVTATNLASVFSYLQANITASKTVAFVTEGNTFVFQDGGANDTLVELVGVTAHGVNTTGLAAGAVWVV